VGAHISNFDIHLLLVISQKVIPDVYMLSAVVFDGIIRHADCTCFKTNTRNTHGNTLVLALAQEE
jgi:hypothetical protein